MQSLLARLLIVVAVAVIPALMLQAFTEFQARQSREQVVRDEALRLVSLVGAAQQEIVAGAEQVLTTLGAAPSVQDNDRDHCHRLLDNLLSLAPRYASIAVIGPDGRRRCEPPSNGPDANLSDRPYFRQALQTNGFVVGEYTSDPLSGRPGIPMAQTFRDETGQVAGVVVLELRLDWLATDLARLPLPEGASSAIMDRSGRTLARFGGGGSLAGSSQEDFRIPHNSTGTGIAPSLSVDGPARMVAYAWVGPAGRNLLVTVGLDGATAFAPIYQAKRTNLLLIVASAVLALVLTAFLATRLIRRPLDQLLHAAERWRSGDLSARSDLSRDRSEFGRLAAALEGMAAALQARERALHMALESTPDAVIVFDREWRYTYENANAKIYTGGDLVGQVIWEVFPETVGTPLYEAFHKAMQTGQPVQADTYSFAQQRHMQTNCYPSETGLTVYTRDLTEQRRIQAALAESEALLRGAFDQAAVGMVLAGADQRTLRVNDKLCEILGYTRQELLGRALDEFSHPDDHAADEDSAAELTKRYVRKDGTLVWADLIISPLRGVDDNQMRYFAVVEDITEQRRIDAALRKSEAQLRLAMDAVRLGVRERDPLTNEPSWTSEAERIFGLDHVSSTTFEGWLAGVHPDDQPNVRARRTCSLSGPERDVDLEYRFRQPDGGWRWVSDHARILFRDGQATRLISVVQDITARKDAETSLAQTTALLRAVGNSSAEAIYAKDGAGRFLYANPAVLAVIGRDADAVIGHVDADWLADPAQAAMIMANDQRIIQTGRTEIIEESYHTAGLGTRVYRSAKAPLRLDDGTVIGVVGVSSDITDLKDAENELRRLGANLESRVRAEVAAREAAQTRAAHAERMQALGQLAGGIAHDFNNVLQAISGAVTLIERRPDDKAAISRFARLASEAAGRGASITRRLLAFGRRGDLRAVAIEPASLLHDLRDILVHSLGAGIDIEVRLAAGLRPFVADKSQLETTLINLATNGRDAMPDGGRLVLSAATEIVTNGGGAVPDGLAPGRYIRLAVEDTGAGMDAATLARATEPFFTTKDVGHGTGLGLAMSKGFAEQSGGAMLVSSTLGKGTTVTLWLPEANPGAVLESASLPRLGFGRQPVTGDVRVLLVEDQDAVREVLGMSLHNAGYAVLTAASGPEALDMLAAGEAVDAVVTDLSMPGMDGLAVIRAVQLLQPKLPAVLLTGYAGDGAALVLGEGVEGGFSLLRKPVHETQLVDCLSTLLASRQAVEG